VAAHRAASVAGPCSPRLAAGSAAGGPLGTSGEPTTLEELERRAIERALERHGGHRQRAADELSIGVRTLYDKLNRYGLG
jgi:two-component system response regulator AtoC